MCLFQSLFTPPCSPTPGWSCDIYEPFVSRWFVKRCFVQGRRSPRCPADGFWRPRGGENDPPSDTCCRLNSPQLQSPCRASVGAATSHFSAPRPVLVFETAHKFSYIFHYIRIVHYTLLPRSDWEENWSHFFFPIWLLKEKVMVNFYNG